MNFVRPIKSSAIATVIRIPLILLIALLPGLFAAGQVKFTTVASSQEVGRSDYLQVEFVVENARQIDNLNPPDFPGFKVMQGPIQSSGMSIVNGNMSQYKAISFVLQPVRTGKFTIGGASATVDGKHMQSNSITINVTAASSGAAGGNAPNNNNSNSNPLMPPSMPDPFGGGEPADIDREYILKPGENIKDKIHKNLFVRVQVDKNSCYVGEPIVATYKLYSRLSSESRVTKRPSLNGFSVYDMIDPNSDAVSVEKLNGKAFTVHIIRKTQLIPLQAGTIDLDPVEVENTVHFVKGTRQERRRSGNALRDLFDQLSNNNDVGPEVDENITLDTKPLAIIVKPLPEENKPANYNGAVGSFSIEASLASKNVAARDEATLHVVVKGKGNLPVINAPPVSFPSGIEAFDPTAKEDVNKTVAPMTGSKSFDYVFTPRTPGHYTIPSISFPYFDPSSQSYKTAGTQPLDLQVAPSLRKEKADAPPAAPVVASPGWWTLGIKAFVQQHLEWIFTVIILSLIAVYLWRQNRRLKKTGQEQKESVEKTAMNSATGTPAGAYPDRQASPDRQANSRHDNLPQDPRRQAEVLRQGNLRRQDNPERQDIPSSSYVPTGFIADPLQEARQCFDNGDYKGFYREVNRAIWKALSKKLDLPASQLNKLNITLQLQARGWDAQNILSLENTLNECEMNLYTPAYDTYNMQQLLRQAESMLDKLH